MDFEKSLEKELEALHKNAVDKGSRFTGTRLVSLKALCDLVEEKSDLTTTYSEWKDGIANLVEIMKRNIANPKHEIKKNVYLDVGLNLFDTYSIGVAFVEDISKPISISHRTKKKELKGVKFAINPNYVPYFEKIKKTAKLEWEFTIERLRKEGLQNGIRIEEEEISTAGEYEEKINAESISIDRNREKVSEGNITEPHESKSYPERKINPEYRFTQFSLETGLEEEDIKRLVRVLEQKGQAILYGPPGTGKTYITTKVARHLIGGNDGFYDLIQFHPAYTYEDFIQGIRPRAKENGSLTYPIVPGRFLEFCNEAKYRKGKCVLIIDEINRANLSRVFGELMYLLEYRDAEIPLAGGGKLSIPPNVFIIGTMNTADRSIAMVDYALRRRFAFWKVQPNYNTLRHFHKTGDYNIEKLIKVLEELNMQIGDPHYEVGVSFFMKHDLHIHLEDIWCMEIEPYLEDYFFDQPDKFEEYTWSKVREKFA